MLKAFETHRSLIIIISLSLLLGVLACMAALKDFYYVFLLPLALCALLYAIFRTEKFILLAGAIAPLSININDIGGGFGLALPTEPAIMFIFTMLLFYFLMQGNVKIEIIKHPLSIAVILYVLWLWISTIFSSMPMVSAKFSLSRTWYITVYFFSAIIIFRKFSNIHFFLKAFVFFTLILVLFTLIKHASDGFVRSSSYGISWPFFPDHGMYAAAITFCVFILVFYGFNGRAFGFNMAWLPIAGFFLLILLFGIVVSYTRAAWLSIIGALGVFAMLKMKIRFQWLMAALTCLSIYTVIYQDEISYNLEANKQGSSDELEGHVKSVGNISTDPSNLERINRWKSASRMVAKRPVFGFGPGTYAFQYAPFQKSSELTIISTNAGDMGDAHSEYLSAMSELGYPGLILWLGMTLITMATGFRIIYKAKLRKVKITALIALLGLVTYYFHALLNNYSQYDKIAVPLWGFMAILVALDLYSAKESEITQPHETPV